MKMEEVFQNVYNQLENTLDEELINNLRKHRYRIQALKHYADDGYVSINRTLRSNFPKLVSIFTFMSKAKKSIKNIFSLFRTLPKFLSPTELCLYRSIPISIWDKIRNDTKMLDLGYTSISLDSYISMGPSKKHRYKSIKVHLLPGLEYNIIPFGDLPYAFPYREREILFNTGVYYYTKATNANILSLHHVVFYDCILFSTKGMFDTICEREEGMKIVEDLMNFFITESSWLHKIFEKHIEKITNNQILYEILQDFEYDCQKCDMKMIFEDAQTDTIIDAVVDKLHKIQALVPLPLFDKSKRSITIEDFIAKIKPDLQEYVERRFTLNTRKMYISWFHHLISIKVLTPDKFCSMFSTFPTTSSKTYILEALNTRLQELNGGSLSVEKKEITLLKNIVGSKPIRDSLVLCLKAIQIFLQETNNTYEKAFQLPKNTTGNSIAGFVPIKDAKDFSTVLESGNQRVLLTAIYLFAMRFSGFLWHYIGSSHDPLQLTSLNLKYYRKRSSDILSSFNITFKNEADRLGQLKLLYESDRELTTIYALFTRLSNIKAVNSLRNARVLRRTAVRPLKLTHLIEPLCLLESEFLGQNGQSNNLPWILGSHLFGVDPDSMYAHIVKDHSLMLTGISGSVLLMIEIAHYFNIPSNHLALACLPWMYHPNHPMDHSLLEILWSMQCFPEFDQYSFKNTNNLEFLQHLFPQNGGLHVAPAKPTVKHHSPKNMGIIAYKDPYNDVIDFADIFDMKK